MPYLAAPLSGKVDFNGDRETPRMDLAIIISGKADPAYVALKERLPTIFPEPQWDPKRPSYSIEFTAFGEHAYKPIYYGGKSNRKNRKTRRRNN